MCRNGDGAGIPRTHRRKGVIDEVVGIGTIAIHRIAVMQRVLRMVDIPYISRVHDPEDGIVGIFILAVLRLVRGTHAAE